jgi:predicted amidohydrolase YtcJ
MRSIWASVLLFVLVTIAGCCCDWTRCCDEPLPPPPPPPPEYAEEGADLVIIGRIRTLDPSQPEATGMVIHGGVVSRLTTADNAVRYASTRTKLVTVPYGGVALPGFIESHAHLRSLGRSLRQLDLRGAKSADEAAARVAAAASTAAPDAWILGRGWNQEDWGGSEWPNRLALDQAAPGHPVALTRVDGHAMWVNSKALELAQIGKSTPDPAGGEILRDQAGEATGILVDNAMDAVQDLVARTATEDEARQDFLRAQDEAFRHGITTFVDCGESPDKLVALSRLYDEGRMKLRVYAMIGCSTAADLEAAFSRPPVPSMFGDRLAVRAIKIYADGALGSRGAWLLGAYSDRPGHFGLPVTDPSLLKAAVRGCLDHGWQLCVHAIGDRANRVVLDAIQEALDKTPTPDHRFRIEHAQCVDPSDLKRFRPNGVIPSIQPCHATSDAAWVFDRLGPERAFTIAYPYRSMLEDWLHPAMGTDAPVESISPVENYYAAVVRKDAGGRLADPFMPEQRMNGMEALLAMTRYGAEAAFCETRRGMLAPGYSGDVVILDRDILTCDEQLIPTTGVAATILAGEVVHERVGSRTISNVAPGKLPGR